MTDAELRDQAVAHLRQTTVGYLNKNWKTPPPGTHWAAALDTLAQIGAAAPPPPPPGSPALPAGPLTKAGPTSYRSATKPVEVSHLDIENAPGNTNGLLIMQWPPALSTGPYSVHDILTQNIGNTPPSSDGTAEAGIWLGQQVNAQRLVCDGTWEGLWTGAMCADSAITDFTVGKADGKGGYTKPVGHIGVYCEHFTRRTLYKNFDVCSTDNGINIEWTYADPTYAPFVTKEYPQAMAGKAGSCHLTFDTGRIYCPAGRTGLFADAGTWGCAFKNLTFWGPGDAIGLPNHLAGPDDNIVDTASCTFQNGGRHVYKHNNAIG